MHIGVIEDNPSIVELVTSALRLEGHTIAVHTSGVDFLQRACPPGGQALFPYDVLILDLGLPGGMSGEDVLTQLEQQGAGKVPPVIVLSGADAETLQRVQKQFPTVAVLTKPMRLATLLQTIAAARNKAGPR